MSYTKLPDTPDMTAALDAALAQAKVADPVAADLLAAGSIVVLETGDHVWASCVVHDRPTTPDIDFIAVAIALQPDLSPWIKPNGQTVMVAWWHGFWPSALADLGIDTARRAMLMVTLGEPQPQVDIPTPAEGGPTQMDALPIGSPAAYCIRSAITAAREISAPVADVL